MAISRIVFSILAFAAVLPSAAWAQTFPLTVEHRFGTTVIPEKPERAVTLTYSGTDHYLVLGIAPVGLRYWYGDHPNAVWPWAQEALGDATPFVLTEINYEQIAALEPDVIEGIASGLTEEQYTELSKIAPVVAAEAKYTDYSTPWHLRARTIGRIMGEEAEADRLVSELEARIAAIAAAHPEWQGMTGAIAFNVTEFGAYRSNDIRAQLLAQLGFVTPEAIDAASPDTTFYSNLSEEDLSPVDADLLIWIAGSAGPERIAALALRERTRAYQEGREVLADDLLTGAFSFATVLSLNYMLDELVPLIELAVDGDPATVVTSTAAAGLLN